MVQLPFQDRTEAGRLLGAQLATRSLANVMVLALPRGGLPVAKEVANALRALLDVVVVRKLGVPWQPELAMGALCGDTRVLDNQIIREFGVSPSQLEAVATREAREMERREKLYRGGRPALDVRGRTVVLVDDGLATGSTMVAAVRHIRGLHPEKLIAAAPVCSWEACQRLQNEADECVCVARPEPFFGVGEWYADFHQVTDGEVQELLRTQRNPAAEVG